MSKSGQRDEQVQKQEASPALGKRVVIVRCTAKKGCQRDNFYYEFNEKFTTTIDVTEEVWKSRILDAETDPKRTSPLSELEICQLAAPDFLEVLGMGRAENLPPPISQQVAHPPKPGQDRMNQQPLSQRIKDVGQTLDHRKDHHWEEDGTPSASVVSQLLGQQVTADQVRDAVPGLKRRQL